MMRRGNQNSIALLLRTSALATAAATLAGPAMAQDYGVIADGPDVLVVTNPAGTTIEGDKIGVFARQGAVVVTNNGTIRGNGSYDGFDFAPEGGITIARAGSSVTNGGTISGAGFGITTAYFFNPETGELEPNAIGTSVANLAGGQIIGDSNDGVRLIGGGTVTNAGTIEGRVGTFADGVSMFAYVGQDTTGQTGIGTVTNEAGGTIQGNRLGVILSGGGTINNAGTILGPNFSGGTLDGVGGGVLIQGQDGASGKIGTITNSGTITGGSGARFGGNLASGSVDNTGTIAGTQFVGIDNSSLGVVTINNQAGGTISGARMGVLAREGAITVANAGTITGNGGGSDGAIVIEAGGSSVSNSGLIQGNSFGITANSYFNTTTGLSEGRAINTSVTNSGTIRGLNNDGVRLIGGGTVTNSGVIEGLASGGADGVSMFTHVGQDTSGFTSVGAVNNLAGGNIFGNRFGIIMSTGGAVDNAGSIAGNAGGIVIQDGLGDGGKTGTVANSGTISGGSGVSFGVELVSSSLTNSGAITGTVNDGVVNSGANTLTIDNLAGGTITGALKGIHAAEGAVIVTNAGSIRGNGTYDGFEATPDGGISIGAGGSSITNSGTISGARFGITTYNYYNVSTGLLEPRATGTTVNNLAGGSIIGEGDDGVRLIGGGTVTNAGTIEGRNFLRAEGVSMFALTGQDTSGQTGIGTVNNLAGGTIFGNRFGIGLSGGGVVNNAGTILASDFSSGATDGFGAGILFQAAPGELGKIGTLSNNGSISGGHGIIYGGILASASITNSGSITGRQSAGVINMGTGTVTIDNQTGGTISGLRSGVLARVGAVNVINAGTITGNGGFSNGAIVIEAGGSSVNNSGLLQGSAFGITANPYFNSVTGLNEARAIGTTITNSGTIRGLNNDGVRLQGGGTITNTGLIEGLASLGADGISMFSLPGQDVSALISIGTINNLAGGSIRGNRFGIIMSNGGTVNNAGSIWAPDFNAQASSGFGGGIVIQDGLSDGTKIATVANTGTIDAGAGVSFGGALAAASLTNSGTITGRLGDGVNSISNAQLTIDNLAGGVITGGRSGVYGEYSPLVLTNAGTIRGNGINSSFNRTDAGVVMVQPGSSVANSGTISGSTFGITTAYLVDANGVFSGRAIDTVVNNSGTIRGDSNDGVRLLGGGTVTNNGLIEGLNSPGSDGVSMFRYDDQDVSARPSIGTVYNLAGGTISGDRFGIILSGGGLIENDGTIRGNTGGLLIQAGNVINSYTGVLINRGAVENGVKFNDGLVAEVVNSGTITNNTSVIAALESLAQITVLNTGTISSTGTHAIRFGLGNDQLTLGTGSQVIGISDGGDGTDTLRLESNGVTTQALGRFDNFEKLDLVSGKWEVNGDTGSFGAIDIAGGELALTGSLLGNVTTSGTGTFRLGAGGAIGGFSGDIVNDGRLIVNIGSDFDITGNFSGTGLFTKQGAGTVSFLGGYNFAGTTQLLGGGIKIAGAINPDTVFDLQSGTLDLSGSTTTTIAGLSGTSSSSLILGGTSNLTVNQSIDTVYAGSISGSGSLIKDGDGRLNLTGTNTYTGATIINDGTLAVNGSITSPVTIKSGATLGGTGATGTVTIESGGTFAPGNSIGTINVKGTLRFQSGSKYLVEASAAGAADRINVTGEAVIGSGVSVQVLAANGNYRPSTTYMILTATNKITGTFASVSTDLAFLEPKLNQTSKYVELTLKRKSNTFASVAADPNQAAVATAVESMGLYNSLYDSVLTQNLAGARAAFDSFSGDFFGTISNRVLGSVQGLQATLQAEAHATPQGPAMWSMVEDGTRTGFTPEYRSGISMARNGFRAAVMTGYVPYERVAVGSEGNASMATHYVGGSIGYNADGWNLQAGAGYARHEIQASRLIAFSGFADGSQTRYSATTRQLFGEVSYSFEAAGLSLTPFASASRLSMSGAQIEENGGDAALSITSAARTLNLASTGFRAEGSYDLGKGLRLNPKLALSWQWAGGDLGTWQQSRFKGNGTRFDIIAAQVSGSGLNVDAGLELAFGRMSLAAEYRRNEVLRNVGDGAHLTFRTAF